MSETLASGGLGAATATVRWIFAGVLSVAMHAGILGAMVFFHTPSTPSAPADRDVAEVQSDATPPSEQATSSPVSEPARPTTFEEPPAPPSPAPAAESRRRKPSAAAAVAPAPAPAAKRTAQEPAVRSGEEDPTESYVVKKGDTLSKIAKAFDSSVFELARLNRTTKEKLANLRVGQRIRVPKAPGTR